MRKKSDKRKLLEYLEENPNMALACRKLGINGSTVYRWKENNIDFARKVETAQEFGRDKLNDFGDGKLVENMQKGIQRAIEYYLNHNHPRYMDPERKDALVKPVKPINTNIIRFADFREDNNPPQENQDKTKEPILLPAPENRNEILGS